MVLLKRIKLQLLVFSLIGLSFSISAQRVQLFSGDAGFQIIENNVSGMEVDFKAGTLHAQKVILDEGVFYRLQSDQMIPLAEEGKPELLVYNRLMELPLNAEAEITIVEKTEIEIDLSSKGLQFPLIPHLLSPAKKEGEKAVFVKDEAIYQHNAFYSEALASVAHLGIMRHVNLARLQIAPYQYNPVTGKLKVVTHVKFKVQYTGASLNKTVAFKQKYYAPSFNVLSSSLINGDIFSFIPPAQALKAERLLIVSDSNFTSTLKPFVQWKERQGFDVTLAYTQNIGSSTTTIKAYLQNQYNSSTPPTYVILVGDVGQIPAFDQTLYPAYPTDLYYFEYTNDDFPEVFYGRFSCEDTTELSNLLEKTLAYEQLTLASYDYMDTTVLVAGADNTYGPTHGNGQVNYGVNEYFNSSNGIVCKSYLFPSSSGSAAQIRADANAGAAMLNYSAHGNYNGWNDPSFKNNDVANMTNVNKYPVMIGNACLTGTYDYNDCFGEVLTNAPQKGAVAYIGAANNTFWDEDFYWAVGYGSISANPSYSGSGMGIFDGIHHTHGEPYSDWSISLAQIVSKGNLAVTQGGSRVQYYWEVYHCFGDPTLVYYVKKPTAQNPSFNNMLPVGITTLNVNAAPYSLVALSMNDTLISSAYADSLGDAQLAFPALTQMGSAFLSITAQNKIPFLDTVTILTPNSPYITYLDYNLNDSAANNNGRADFGEQIKLGVKLANLTSFNSTNLDVKISVQDTTVQLLDSMISLSIFPGFDTLTLQNAFTLQVGQVVPNQHMVKVNVEVSDAAGGSWNHFFFVQLHAPEIAATQIVFNDAAFGNGDGLADAGETIMLSVQVKNTGSGDLSNGASNFQPSNNLLSGSTGSLPVASLKADSTYWLDFMFVVDAGASDGSICLLNFDLQAQGYSIQEDYYVVVGQVDEDFESGDFSKFSWQNSGDSTWYIVPQAYQGAYASQSGTIDDNESTTLSLSLNVLKDDTIHFFMKVSSEYSYDYLQFYIDNAVVDQWSGFRSWKLVSYPVSKGNHLFEWTYSKDVYMKEGSDAAWVDNIIFPITDVWSGISYGVVEQNGLQIAPNPAMDQVQLQLKSPITSDAKLRIYRADGSLVRRELWKANQTTYSLDVNDLAPGNYYISVQNGSTRFVKQLVKL